MGFDAVLKRVFPAVVLALLAVAAYFQASGIGQLLAAASGEPSSSPASQATVNRAPTPLLARSDHATSGKAILDRNPFDSITGPFGQPKPDTVSPDETPEDDAPPCDAGRVVLITWSEEPEWSFASIAGSDGKSALHRKGDKVGDRTVESIDWDRVWLAGDSGRRCQLAMGAAMPKARAGGPIKGTPEGDKGGRKTRVPEKIASKIHPIDAGHVTVERAVIDDVLELQAELFRSVRALPDKEGGLRLSGIPRGSLTEMLGLKNGDRVETVNGIDVSNPGNAIGALTQLRSASRLTVALHREGKPTTIDVQIQ